MQKDKKCKNMKPGIEKKIPAIRKFFETQPIEKAWIFGSCARGENTRSSDIDILVQYSTRISLLGISRIMTTLSQLINKKVDLVEDGRLMPFAVESVNKDKILIYEREN